MLVGIGKQLAKWLPPLIIAMLAAASLVNYLGDLFGLLPAWLSAALDIYSNFSAVFLGIVIEAVPFLLMGTLASGIVEIFLDREELARWIPRHPVAGALAGSLFGLFFPVCECGVVPLARRLMQKGVPVPVAVTTLLAAPVINPIVFASTLSAFGTGNIFWGRFILTLLIASVTGLVFSLHSDPGQLLRPSSMPPPILSPMQQQDPLQEKLPVFARLKGSLLIAADEFFEMGRYLVIGALLAALMQTFVRQQALLAVGQGPVLSVIVMAVMAFFLSICSTVDAFIALAFAGTFTTGAVLTFLVFGPMVDLKSTMMFLHVFKPRAVIYLILFPLMLAFLGAFIVNIFV